ncbi:MAG: RNA polymerase sigma factor [candidate division WOR-3 bacterium]
MDKNEKENLFNILYDKYFDRIWKYVYYKVSNREDAQDLCQEIFFKVYKGLDKFEGRSSYYTWIFKIAMNSVISFYRKRKFIKFIPLDFVDEKHYSYERDEKKEKIFEKMKMLPEEIRETLELYYISSFKVKEIAEILGVPEGTVKTRLKRGRELLIELLK